ncbi:MAG: Uma2 family endonuclease [Deltaproteobacteria bacterium]|nr:Uma2 family endonuclease [Deltaproteobacteria bacterium]
MGVRLQEGRPATRADLEALPKHVKGEIIDGVLYTSPRPRPLHARGELALGADLLNAYQRGRGGPGGWWILVEPGIEVPGSPELSPDVAGWRRERLIELPTDPITVVRDWIGEFLSPSTRHLDQRVKRPFYARIGVGCLWFVDLDGRTLTVSKLVEGRWVELAVHGADERVRAEPFEAAELDLREWWGAGEKEG